MPLLSLGLSTKDRKTSWTPDVRVVNFLVEQSSTNGYGGVDHIQRPGLAPFAEVGDGPIRGVLRQAGTFDGDFLVASGDEWFRVDQDGFPTLLGDIPGDFRTTTAATPIRAITVSDGIAYSTDGTSVVEVNMPDGQLVGSVAQLNGYFILTVLNSALFYWIEPGQVDPDGLSFAETESTPGDNVKVERVGDELYFFKEEGMEVWVPTGNADLPFQRTQGRNYIIGALSRDAVNLYDNSVAWVGNDRKVYRAESIPTIISTPSVEEWLRKSDALSFRMWAFDMEGHRLLVITTDRGTQVYDVASQQWSEFESYDRPFWRAHVGDSGDEFVVAGDDELGLLYRLDPERSNDNGEPMVRVLGGGAVMPGGSVGVDNLCIYVTTGTALNPIERPKMEVRWSDNLRTYGDPRLVSLGVQGEYGKEVRLTRLGRMGYPGRLYEFRVTGDLVTTISGAAYNMPTR